MGATLLPAAAWPVPHSSARAAGKVKVWDAGTGACLRTLEGPDEGITWLQWHPRGGVLVAGSEDFTSWMWNADNGQCMQVPPPSLLPWSCMLAAAACVRTPSEERPQTCRHRCRT